MRNSKLLRTHYVARLAEVWRQAGLSPSRATHPENLSYKSSFHRYTELVLTGMAEPWAKRHNGEVVLKTLREDIRRAHADLPRRDSVVRECGLAKGRSRMAHCRRIFKRGASKSSSNFRLQSAIRQKRVRRRSTKTKHRLCAQSPLRFLDRSQEDLAFMASLPDRNLSTVSAALRRANHERRHSNFRPQNTIRQKRSAGRIWALRTARIVKCDAPSVRCGPSKVRPEAKFGGPRRNTNLERSC